MVYIPPHVFCSLVWLNDKSPGIVFFFQQAAPLSGAACAFSKKRLPRMRVSLF